MAADKSQDATPGPRQEMRPADYNLLWGMIAWQFGIVSEAKLFSAMKEWTFHKHQPLAEILVSHGAITEAQRQQIEAIVQAQAQLHGGSPDAALAAMHSVDTLASGLRQVVTDPDLDASLMKLSLRDETPPSAQDHIDTLVPKVNLASGRFSILRPHAKGGLGEVFVALDRELNREVALKEIQSAYAWQEESQRRFRLEAEVTGALEHPGIVPVYALGHHPDGRPFYAMRFIRGTNLKFAIERYHQASNADTSQRNLEFRELLRKFVNVCNALEFAHSRGVLHRDLKPTNVMLGDFGETLVVDWGLARVIAADKSKTRNSSEKSTLPAGSHIALRPGSGSDGAETVYGQAMGTLQYMSPEQAEGRLDELAPATDIYSMGAILYEVLTNHPPIEAVLETDGKIDVGLTLQKVQRGQIKPPAEVAADVPRPLEAICLKALSTQMADRYASSKELAADVERWLADESVSALADGVLVKARRVLRRHPAWTAGSAAAILFITAGLLIFSTVVGSKNQELSGLNFSLTNKNGQLQVANERESDARLLAQKQSQLALQLLGEIVTDVQSSLQDVPGGSTARRKLLNTALGKIEEVASQYTSQSVADHHTMVALLEMGEVISEFSVGMDDGDRLGPGTAENPSLQQRGAAPTPLQGSDLRGTNLAVKLIDRAVKIAERLAEAQPGDAQASQDLARAHRDLGRILLNQGRLLEAEKHIARTCGLLQELSQGEKKNTADLRSLAESLDLLGDIRRHLGNLAAATQPYGESFEIRKQLLNASPDDYVHVSDVANSLERMGDVASLQHDLKSAQNFYQLAFDSRKMVSDAHPDSVELLDKLAVACERLGSVLKDQGEYSGALERFNQAHQISQRLAQRDPQNLFAQRGLSIACERIGDTHRELGDTAAAISWQEKSLAIDRSLAALDPDNTVFQSNVGISLDRLAELLMSANDMDKAEAAAKEAYEISRRLMAEFPHDTSRTRGVIVASFRLANIHMRRERYSTALEIFSQVIPWTEQLARDDPENRQAARDLLVARSYLGLIQQKAGDRESALVNYQLAHDAAQKQLQDTPGDRNAKRDMMIAYQRLGSVSLELDQRQAASGYLQQAVYYSGKSAEEYPDDAQAQEDFVIALFRLGEARMGDFEFDLAQQDFQRTLAVMEQMNAKKMLADTVRTNLGYAHEQIELCRKGVIALGDLDEVLRQPAEELPSFLDFRASAMLKRHDFSQAAQAAERLLELQQSTPELRLSAAKVLFVCARQIVPDSDGMLPPDRGAERTRLLQRGVQCLSAEIAAGTIDLPTLLADPAIAPLKDSEEFQGLIKQM